MLTPLPSLPKGPLPICTIFVERGSLGPRVTGLRRPGHWLTRSPRVIDNVLRQATFNGYSPDLPVGKTDVYGRTNVQETHTVQYHVLGGKFCTLKAIDDEPLFKAPGYLRYHFLEGVDEVKPLLLSSVQLMLELLGATCEFVPGAFSQPQGLLANPTLEVRKLAFSPQEVAR